MAQQLVNLIGNRDNPGLILGLTQWVKDPALCGVGHRRGSDPVLLWLWCRQAATVPSGPLAWEPLYSSCGLEKTKRSKKKKK